MMPRDLMSPVILVWFTILGLCHAIYHENYMHAYAEGEEIWVYMNSLTSLETLLPFSYYSLPHCIPKSGIKVNDRNLGQLLMSDQIVNSAYMFRVNKNESLYLCTTIPLNEHQAKQLKQQTRDLYQINTILDNLPVRRFAEQNGISIQWTGYPVGFSLHENSEDYIINHLKFKVHLHEYDGRGGDTEPEYEIVGFEVVPCSVKRDPEVMEKHGFYEQIPTVNCPLVLEKSQVIGQQEKITYTYEVVFVKSDIRWSSRWDTYLKMDGEGVHWFSITGSTIVILVLTSIIFVIIFNVRSDFTHYEKQEKGTLIPIKEELSGWKLVIGDVFREPSYSKQLCVVVGEGVQIICTAMVTIICAAFGFMSPASRGMLLTGVIILYFIFGIAAGYAGVRLWKTIKGSSEGWISLVWSISVFFPGIVFVILTILNFVLWESQSTGAIPISLYLILLSLWFGISVPLTLLGGFFAARTESIQFPAQTDKIPHEIPARKYPSWLLAICAGILPFGTIFVELFFILSCIWLGRFYYVFGFLLLALLLMAIVCAEVSVLLTYMHLNMEDWRWWWRSFFASGSTALFVFLYFMIYLAFDLGYLEGPASAVIYIGYSLIIALAIMLSTGTIGFLMSFYFVHNIFSLANVD